MITIKIKKLIYTKLYLINKHNEVKLKYNIKPSVGIYIYL